MGKILDRSVLDGKTVKIFRAAVKSKRTLDPYERRLIGFLSEQRMTCDDFIKFAKRNHAKTEQMVIDFIIKEKVRAETGHIANSTVANTIKPVKLLLDMNDVVLNWKKIKKLMPSVRRYALDRIPTMEELREIVDHSDERGKALTLLFCSSGIREGAIELLRVKNLRAIEADGIKLGKLVVYEGEEEQYLTFVSPEAYEAVIRYLEWRRDHGEEITGESPLFRDKFDASITQYLTYGGGIPDKPRVLAGPAIRMYYNRLFHELGFRQGPKRRHEFSVHGFRKFFKTKCENAGVKPITTEILMGHSVGISDSYYRPSEKDLLSDYLKAVNSLSILQLTELKVEIAEQKVAFEQRFSSLEARLNSLVGSALEGKQVAQR